MSTVIDAEQTIIDLLTDNWDDLNTDRQTPKFVKIFQQSKEIDFGRKRDYVLIFNGITETAEVGIGNNVTEDVFETVTIDVRSKNRNVLDTTSTSDDDHFKKVTTEISRILKTNKVNPDTNFNELRSTQQWIDFNDRARGIFRRVKTVELVQYCRDFTA